MIDDVSSPTRRATAAHSNPTRISNALTGPSSIVRVTLMMSDTAFPSHERTLVPLPDCSLLQIVRPE